MRPGSEELVHRLVTDTGSRMRLGRQAGKGLEGQVRDLSCASGLSGGAC